MSVHAVQGTSVPYRRREASSSTPQNKKSGLARRQKTRAEYRPASGAQNGGWARILKKVAGAFDALGGITDAADTWKEFRKEQQRGDRRHIGSMSKVVSCSAAAFAGGLVAAIATGPALVTVLGGMAVGGVIYYGFSRGAPKTLDFIDQQVRRLAKER